MYKWCKGPQTKMLLVHLFPSYRFFFSGEEIVIDLVNGGVKLVAVPLEHETGESCFSLPMFVPIVPSTTPTLGHFVLFPVLLTSRDQDGGPLTSTIDIFDLTEK